MVNTYLANVTNLPQLVVGVDGLTNGFFFTGLFIVVYIGIFAGFKVYDSMTALAGSSFIMFIVGLFMLVSGINTNTYVIWVPFTALLLSMIINYFNR